MKTRGTLLDEAKAQSKVRTTPCACASRACTPECRGAIRMDMQPGDLMLHDTTLFHGSPATRNSPFIRRVIYYEFCDARFTKARHRPGSGAAKPESMTWNEEWTHAAHDGDTPFQAHPAESLRVAGEEAARSPLRVPHPGWDA